MSACACLCVFVCVAVFLFSVRPLSVRLFALLCPFCSFPSFVLFKRAFVCLFFGSFNMCLCVRTCAFYIYPHELLQRKANPYAPKMIPVMNALAVVPARTKFANVMKASPAKSVP